MKKPNKTFFKNIELLNNAADLIMEEFNGKRTPHVLFIRAFRTIIDPNCKEEIKHSSINELIYEICQMIIEFICGAPIDADLTTWVLNRNCCMPPVTKDEINELNDFIKKVRETNNVR